MSPRGHVVLAGDSIFDNDVYVPGEPGVLSQLKQSLPAGWVASKVAVDGDVIADVRRQVKNLPPGVTDLIVSVGGNDALGHAHLLEGVRAPEHLSQIMQGPLAGFRAELLEPWRLNVRWTHRSILVARTWGAQRS